MDFSKYIFRSHYQGNLVSVPKPLTGKQIETLNAYREKEKLTDKQKADWHSLENKLNESKIYKLSDTAKNLCHQIVFNEKFGRNTILENKYFAKGLAVEKDGRDLISLVLNTFLVADDERKVNNWVSGKRDIKHENVIIDIKNSFSFESFNKHKLESNHENYFRQLDCYMELWNIEDSIIAYTLVDTPIKLVNDELRRLNWKEDIFNFEGNIYEEKIEIVTDLIKNLIFTRKGIEEYCQQSSNVMIEWFDNFIEIPENDRVYMVSHKFDKSRIEQRNECLKLARDYMQEWSKHNI